MKRHRDNGGAQSDLTLQDALWRFGYLASALALCWWMGRRLGTPGYFLGFMVGLIAFYFAALLGVYLFDMVWRGRPALPDCRSGRCGLTDYKIEDHGREVHFLCRCRMEYVRRGYRFLEVLPDGSEKPYLRWRPFRGWEHDF